MPTLETVPATQIIQQTRVIRASREHAYQAWTDPEVLKQWFGSAGNYCPSATLDVRVGGAYRIDMAPVPETGADPNSTECGQRQVSASGFYTRVVPNELLQFTWQPSFIPEEDSLVTVTFTDVRGGTQIDVHHERFLPGSPVENYNKGWAGCLDKLEGMAERL